MKYVKHFYNKHCKAQNFAPSKNNYSRDVICQPLKARAKVLCLLESVSFH